MDKACLRSGVALINLVRGVLNLCMKTYGMENAPFKRATVGGICSWGVGQNLSTGLKKLLLAYYYLSIQSYINEHCNSSTCISSLTKSNSRLEENRQHFRRPLFFFLLLTAKYPTRVFIWTAKEASQTRGRPCFLLNLGWAVPTESKGVMNWELEEKEREKSCCQQALMVNRCGELPHYSLACSNACTPTHTRTRTPIHFNTHSQGVKAKQ